MSTHSHSLLPTVSRKYLHEFNSIYTVSVYCLQYSQSIYILSTVFTVFIYYLQYIHIICKFSTLYKDSIILLSSVYTRSQSIVFYTDYLFIVFSSHTHHLGNRACWSCVVLGTGKLVGVVNPGIGLLLLSCTLYCCPVHGTTVLPCT